MLGRHVDRHAQFPSASFRESACCAAGLGNHPQADPVHHAALLGHIQELLRRQQAPRGMLPTQQGFRPDDCTTANRKQRLEEQLEFLAIKRPAQIVFDGQALQRRIVQLRGIEAEGVLAKSPGLVQRGFRAFEQGIGIFRINRKETEADIGRQVELLLCDPSRQTRRVDQLFSQQRGIHDRLPVGQDDRKLHAAGAGEHCIFRQEPAHALYRFLDHEVAEIMAVQAIDPAEP